MCKRFTRTHARTHTLRDKKTRDKTLNSQTDEYSRHPETTGSRVLGMDGNGVSNVTTRATASTSKKQTKGKLFRN
jgi:hypothetical protein